MTRKERRALLLEFKMDPQGFADRAYNAALIGDWEFLAKAGEALQPRGPEFPTFNERIQAAFAKLFFLHGPNQVSLAMIREAVDPKIALSNYSTAAKEIGARHLLKRSRRKG
jgi:hypothetical protein